MNKMKKIFSILLMVVFLVNTFLGSTSKNAFADGTLKTQLRIINLNGDGTIDENTEFWVNKDIPAAADLTVSGTGVNIQNPKLKITVQKTNSTTRPEFVDSQKAVKNERTEDNDNYYMTYSFDRLNGGAKLTFPMPFKFLESANKGDTVTIKEELFDENGGLIDSATKTYVANKVGYTFNDSSVYADTPDQLQQLIDPSKPAKNNTLFVRKVDDYTDSDKTKEDGEGTQVNSYYNFTVKDTATVDPNATYMSPENIKIELKLPEGVDVMDGRFSFDPATRTATRIVNKPSLDRVWKGSYNEIVYWFGTGLLFKGKKYNEVINIEAKFTVNAGLADEKKLPDRTLPIKLEKNKLTFGAQRWTEVLKYKLNAQGNDPVPNRVNNGVYTLYNNKLFDDWNNDQTDNGLMYITRIGNENNGSSPTNPGGGIRLHLWEIEDVLMRDKPVQDEKKIYYKYFQLGKVEKFRDRGGDDTRRQQLVDDAINQVNSTPNKLYGIKEDGSKVELASNIKLGQRVDINDTTGQYTRLSLVFERPISLDNTALFYYTGAYPSEKEIKKFEDGEYDKEQYYYGSEHIVAEEAENATTKENAKKSEGNSIWAWTGLRLPTPKAYIGNFNGTGVLPYKADGTYADIHLDHASLRGRYGAWGPYLGKPVTNPKIIYLLPAEFSFVKTKAIATNGIDKSKIGEPEVIKNFRNTGRTAVIYSLPDITPTLEDKNDTIWMDLQIEASPYAKQGNNQVDVFYTYDNNDIIQPWNDDQTYVDELDLDGDGNKKEKFTHRKHDINFIPPLELLMYKNVGLTTDNMRYAEVGDVGEPFYWKVSINNNTISEVTDISFIDTLPFVGDHVITPNKKGEYKERGSKFMTPLANSLESVKANEEVLKNFDVYYQLKPQNILETVRDGEWLSKDQVTDFSQVKSIKVMLKPGAKLASKTTVDFYIPSKIPFDTTLTETQTANNSVAISTDKYSYSEANTATIGVARYTIKGTVFSDFNKDGLMADNEEKLSGYKVELIDKKTGDVAVDVTGQKLETTTDNEGKYTINAYKRGDYFVRFTKLSDEDVLTKSNDKANGNNATEEIAGTKFVKTADFALNPTNNNIVKNAGFEGTKRDVTVEKVDSQLNQDGSKKYLANAIFELKQNGTVVDTQTTDQNGRAVFKGVKFGSYKLVETKAPTGYAAVNTEKDITVDENGDAKYEIANDLVLGKVEVTKVDKDDPTKKLKGVKFVLKQGNDEKYEATTGEDGKAVFDGVLFGSYKLVEKETLENYKADSTEHDVTIDNQTKLKEVTIKNELKKGKVVVTKVDATDNTKKLQGVKFALKQDGNVKYELETDADGKAVFNGVAYGKYKLVETKPLDNYLPDTTERDVNIDADGKEVPFEITNALKEGKVEVTKVDADDNSKKLEGVKFALKQGNDVKYEATTDADGKAVFNGVAYGDYKLVETKHLDNYNADTTERDVTIDSQNTIKQLTITNTLIKGKVEVTLVDAVVDGKPIKGATFVLKQGDTVVKEVVTDDSGKVVFENVPYGEYTVVEKTTLENYVIDSAPKAVKIEQQGQVEKVQVVNVLKTSNVKVTKVDADDNTKKLAGVEFELRGANGKVLKGTTNANGEYIFEDVVYGDYKLVETKTLDNYNLTTTEETVQVRDAGQTIEKTVTNALKKGKVEVTKVDADDNTKKLAGVKFELKQGDEVKYEGTTDANGKLVIDNVIYGDYKLVEKETLENYNLNTNPVDVSIKAQGQLVEKTVENTLKKGKVEVTAVDADDNTKKLPGIKFVLKQGDEVKYEGTTDANGKLVFDKVVYGDYKLVEKETLENYNLNKDQFDVSIKEEGQLVEKTVPNLLKKGKVEVTKVDAEDNTKKLAGVKFALKQGNDVKYEGTTDANGKLVFDKVVYGDYKLVETETLENYNLNKDQFDVSIKEEGQLVEKTVTNQIIKSDVKFVKVDAKDNNKKLAGVKFVLKQGDVEKYEAISDANGVVSFKGVVYGEYTLVEKETIAGYKLSTETKQVQVRTHGVVIDLGNFANEPIAKAPGKKTGSLAKTGLAETSTTLLGTMLLALAMLFRRKSTK